MAPKPDLTVFVPQHPDEITVAWLTEVLRGNGAIRSARVTSFESGSPGSGVGFSGITARLDLTYDIDEAGAPTRIVAKFPTDMAHRGITEMEGTYEREIWFYEGLAADWPGPIPRCFYSFMDPGQSARARRRASRMVDRTPMFLARPIVKRAHRFIRPSKRRFALLLDYVPDARVTGLDEVPPDEDIAAILDAMATVHAHYWRDPRLKDDPACSYDTASQNSTFLRAGFEVFAPDVYASMPEIGTVQKRALQWAQDNLAASLRIFNQPLTLLHGDARTDNMLFTPDGSLTILDFGAVSSGAPSWDVMYTLSAALTPGSDARSRFHRFARGYHDALTDLGVVDYSWDTFLNELDIALCFQGHRMVLAQAVMEGGYEDDSGNQTGFADIWMRKVLDLLPTDLPTL